MTTGFKTFILVVMVLFYSTVGAQDDKPSEYQIKAVFLFNFANFVEWPEKAFADSTAPLVIAILGEDPFGDILGQVVEGETVGKRKITIKKMSEVSDTGLCHILYTVTDKWTELEELFDRLEGSNVLAVGEVDDFIELGGTIGLIKENNRIRFEINMASAERSGLRISSKLQKVAKRIIKE